MVPSAHFLTRKKSMKQCRLRKLISHEETSRRRGKATCGPSYSTAHNTMRHSSLATLTTKIRNRNLQVSGSHGQSISTLTKKPLTAIGATLCCLVRNLKKPGPSTLMQ